jgi:hypothetical protein
LIGLERRTMP